MKGLYWNELLLYHFKDILFTFPTLSQYIFATSSLMLHQVFNSSLFGRLLGITLVVHFNALGITKHDNPKHTIHQKL